MLLFHTDELVSVDVRCRPVRRKTSFVLGMDALFRFSGSRLPYRQAVKMVLSIGPYPMSESGRAERVVLCI